MGALNEINVQPKELCYEALPQNVVEKAESCGLKPILTLMGALNEINVQPKELCYEAPFGVGYLTEQFIFA
jgi:aromatic ring-opening dioxygenase LigB subunit